MTLVRPWRLPLGDDSLPQRLRRRTSQSLIKKAIAILPTKCAICLQQRFAIAL
jgi:hypothetical protein